ncbi:hypothetical protein UYSO10_4464 [Kosakonia radicincitans]|uniref:PIN domain-containing protein n=1 Tax=Kosakonia radicincitans TaxID=283686 RepID=UPI00118213D9|nr:PIN domain-containing protein [Kosakonia radicincitans]VVT52942.1 hypothetical protein UYSO10_4464 [Kosakonia radicincitans]
MRSTFVGFYSSASQHLQDIWLSDSTLFVFDTNCLLNLYRCEEHTREDILSVMREIKSRVWIPFQVGFEYQRNRRGVIEESINSLLKIKKELENIYTKNLLSFGGIKKYLYNNLDIEISELQQNLKVTIDNYINDKIEQRIADKESISEHDFIRDSIDDIILDKVGPIPTQQEIDDINREGDKRYAKKQPPGFRDNDKKSVSYFSDIELQDKFGDLYLWMQMIERAKPEAIKNVIFVCDDNKQDWWFVHSGKTHGALEALKTEICNIAKIDNFKIINQLTFLNEAENYLANIKVSESSLREVAELSNKTLALDEFSPIRDEEYNWQSYFEAPIILTASKKKNIFNTSSNEESYSHDKNHSVHYSIDLIIENSQIVLKEANNIREKFYDNRATIIKIIDVTDYFELEDELQLNINRLESLIANAEFEILQSEGKIRLSTIAIMKRFKNTQEELEKSMNNIKSILSLIS